MSNQTHCPNCNIKLSGTFKQIQLFNKAQNFITNEYTSKDIQYCYSCGVVPFRSAYQLWSDEVNELNKGIESLISNIPVITMQKPSEWDISILGIVTAQAVLGTGFITEISSSFSDFLGSSSNKHVEKLKAGEKSCFAQLRKYAMDLGGNAIIATDIDYSEVGGSKAMLMVCMAGTAIHINNTSILGEKHEIQLDLLKTKYSRLQHLIQYGSPANIYLI